MNKNILLFNFVIILIVCDNSSKEIDLPNIWFNTISRDQVFRDSEYNVIKVEPAIDTTYLIITDNKITIKFKLKYINDSIKSYDTTAVVSYTKKGKKLLIKIRNKDYLAGFKIKDGYLYFQEMDKIPIIIKNTDFIFSRKIYQTK
jgi:hypothetical protein